jgi:hypothetical protein
MQLRFDAIGSHPALGRQCHCRRIDRAALKDYSYVRCEHAHLFFGIFSAARLHAMQTESVQARHGPVRSHPSALQKL